MRNGQSSWPQYALCTARAGCSCWLLFAVISPAPLRSIEDFRGEHRLFAVFSLYITAKTATAQKADPREVGTGVAFWRSGLDDAFLAQRLDLSRADPEPVVQNLGAVRPERRRSFQSCRLAVDAHRPGRHLVVAVVVMDGLHDAALLEARLVLQFHRVEHRARRYPDGDQFLHRLTLVVLAGPFAAYCVRFPFVLDAGVAGGETRVVDQLFAADQFHQPRPVLGVGPAGGQVDVVVGAAALGWVQPRGRVVAAARLGAIAPRSPAGAGHRRKAGAHVMDHRVLHRHLEPPALAGAVALVQGAEDRRRHQHAGAGVAKGEARLDRRAVWFAGDADRAARCLRDHVESEPLLMRAAGSEALDLAIDDAGVEPFDRFVIEPQALDRAGRHVFDRDISFLQ